MNSYTTPCPATAASPCIKIGNILEVSPFNFVSIFALEIPPTTAFTVSRCDGFGAKSMRTFFPPSLSLKLVQPMWYFTSPSKSSASSYSLESNSLNMSSGDFPNIFVNTFRRPLWAIPTTNCSTPLSAPLSIRVSNPGIIASTPSIEKRF